MSGIHDYGRARGRTKFTIYDTMDFGSNPANRDAVDQNGQSVYVPAAFPMMVYHPSWEKRQTNKGEMIATPFGPKMVNEQWETIWLIVNSQEELDAKLAEGWNTSPSQEAASALQLKDDRANAKVNGLETEIEDLKKQLAAAQAKMKHSSAVDLTAGVQPKVA